MGMQISFVRLTSLSIISIGCSTKRRFSFTSISSSGTVMVSPDRHFFRFDAWNTRCTLLIYEIISPLEGGILFDLYLNPSSINFASTLFFKIPPFQWRNNFMNDEKGQNKREEARVSS